MKYIYKYLPQVLPWVLFVQFLQPLLFQLESRVEYIETKPEIILEADETDSIRETSHFYIRKGTLSRLSILKEFIQELDSLEIPADGFPEDILARLNRILFGQKMAVVAIIFLALLSITSFIAWIYEAWFRITLNRILYWAGILFSVSYLFSVIPHIPFSMTGLFLGIYYSVLIVLLGLGLKAIRRGDPYSRRFEILKHATELDEEGKRQTTSINWNPVRVFLHFAIIILVGIVVGNFLYIPLFILQKHFSREFGFLIIGLIVSLCVFYVRNYFKLSEDPSLSRTANILSSVAYLQYKFIKNLALGIGITALVALFISILFSILLLNSSILKDPSLGIIENSAEL